MEGTNRKWAIHRQPLEVIIHLRKYFLLAPIIGGLNIIEGKRMGCLLRSGRSRKWGLLEAAGIYCLNLTVFILEKLLDRHMFNRNHYKRGQRDAKGCRGLFLMYHFIFDQSYTDANYFFTMEIEFRLSVSAARLIFV